MRVRVPVQVLLALLSLCVAAVAHAGESAVPRILERGTLVVGTSGNMPTMSFIDDQGRPAGFDIDLARIMADVMETRLEIRVMPFADLLPALGRGEVDMVISNLTITPRRNLEVSFVGPYMTSGKCVVSRDQRLSKPDGSQDVNTAETTLAVLAGSTSEDFARELLPQATLLRINSYPEGVRLLLEGKATGMLTDYPVCLATLKENPDAGLESVFSRLTYEPIGIALPAGDARFINFAEHLLERLDQTGALEELARRWFGQKALAQD